jgi:hypothetical protein
VGSEGCSLLRIPHSVRVCRMRSDVGVVCPDWHGGMSATGQTPRRGWSGRVRGGQVHQAHVYVRRPARFRALHRRDGGRVNRAGLDIIDVLSGVQGAVEALAGRR